MAKIELFLHYLQEQFEKLEALLIKIMKKEESIHDEILIKKGFIIHSYSLNYGAINLDVLSEILAELEKVSKKEGQLQDDLEKYTEELNKIERDFETIAKKKLHTDLLFEYLKDALYYSGLMITRIKQLEAMLQDGIKLNKKSTPKEAELFFASFENVGNKILSFITFLKQLTLKIINFEKDAYYPEPKTYGRAMSKKEYKKTISERKLSSSKDPTPVFDATADIIEKIKMMSKDQRKNFFGSIGVASSDKVIFFQTKLKPINPDTPISQSNGLREYKFPKGIEVEILEAV